MLSLFYNLLYILYSIFSDHNWNTLFLSADAVARAMATKYGTDKSAILDDVSYFFLLVLCYEYIILCLHMPVNQI